MRLPSDTADIATAPGEPGPLAGPPAAEPAPPGHSGAARAARVCGRDAAQEALAGPRTAQQSRFLGSQRF